jgi:hypothetical protein
MGYNRLQSKQGFLYHIISENGCAFSAQTGVLSFSSPTDKASVRKLRSIGCSVYYYYGECCYATAWAQARNPVCT